MTPNHLCKFVSIVLFWIFIAVLISTAAMAMPPANNSCESATLIGNGLVSGNSAGATQNGESECDGPGLSNDIWFKYVAQERETIYLSTEGSQLDTIVSVHGTCPPSGSRVCNDDTRTPPSTSSELSVRTFEDESSLWIRVAGYDGAGGPFQLRVGPGSRLSGRVIDAQTGEPLAGQRISAGSFQQGVSDQDGRFTMEDLPPGSHYPWFAGSETYLPQVYGDVSDCFPRACNPRTRGTPVMVGIDEHVRGIDFALERAGSLSGAVVDSASGAPLAGISIDVRHPPSGVRFEATTDPAGKYFVGGLPTGSFTATTDNFRGYRNQVFADVPCLEGQCDETLATPIPVVAGEATNNIDFALDRLGAIAGTVSFTNQPVDIFGSVSIYDGSGAYRDTASVFRDGSFQSEGLEPGTYFVSAERLGYLPELYEEMPCLSGICDPLLGTPVEVALSETTEGITFTVDRLGTIRGRVTDAQSGDGLDALIVIWNESGEQVAFSESRIISDGFFEHDLVPGAYFVTTETVFYEDEVFNNLPCPAPCDVTQGTPIEVELATVVDNIDFALDRLRTGTITGTVRRRSDGAPLVARVTVTNDAGLTGAYVSVDVLSDENGHFAIPDLPPGTYFASASKNGLISQLFDDRTCSGCFITDGDPIPVRGDEVTANIDFALDAYGAIAGQAKDAATGEPLAIHVRLYNEEGLRVRDQFEPDGSILFERLLPGNYFLISATARYLAQRHAGLPCTSRDCEPTAGTPIRVEVGQETEVDVALVRGDSISGRVSDAVTGKGVALMLIGALHEDGYLASIAGVHEGSYEIRGLAPGKYYVITSSLASDPYIDELFDDVECSYRFCDLTPGRLIEVRQGMETSGVDFELLPLAEDFACSQSAYGLCLNRGRFHVQASWWALSGEQGRGFARPLTDDSGYFWFFDQDNVELVVKLLDGCFAPFNHFWFFAAGLTDVEVALEVTDTVTGEHRTYRNLQGTDFAPILDTRAFESCLEPRKAVVMTLAEALESDAPWLALEPEIRDKYSQATPSINKRVAQSTAAAGCQPDGTTHCLNQGRFRVEARWRAPDGQAGVARTALALEDTGFFWFFDSDNIELAVKVLDACTIDPFNSFWVFAAGLTNVEVVLTITDTVSGETREYLNPQGTSFVPIQDTLAFDTCDVM